MELIVAVAFTIILVVLYGLVLRQLTRKKKSPTSLEEIQSVKDLLPGHEHEVFLSFRGPDTRDNFTDCLYHRLKLAGVHVFLDNENLRIGKEISGELLKALDKSRIYIPIFSKNYATSSWCLREVAHMVECTSNSDGKKEILPIFFDVDPDDVKLRTKLYRKAIPKHKKKFGSEELKRWEAALVKVARMKGWGIKGKRHGEQIELVVKEVLRKLNAKNVDVPEYLVEDHRQIKALVQKLDVDSDDVRFVGIHGIGGIGKTTIAKVVFDRLSSHFDGVSFLEDVRTSYHHSLDGLASLQEKLLSSVLGSTGAVQIKDTGDGMEQIKRVCSTKRVLIVLDDLDKKEQLEKLAGKSDWFGCGSRIIITTRDTGILNQNEEILHYEVQDMEFDGALQLFCKCAFRSDSPMEDYVALSKQIVHKVAGLPLAVELIGSSLYDVGSDLDTDGEKRKLWEETLKQLDEGPVKGVRDVLIISYKGLEDKQKEVFLDIACFFTNEDQTHPIIMWDVCDYYPRSAINVLRLRSLIKIRDNKFWMHDQVRDLGRQIILEEYPHRFSRAWIHKDAIRLLGRKERNEDVQALSFTSDGCSRNITLEELAALPNLRFLRVRGIDIFGDFENLLLKLRWLFWQKWQIILRRNNFLFSNLVMLDFSDSDVEYGWHGWNQMKMNKLKVLDLTDCMRLKRTPDFSNFISLEILILARCVHLTTIDGSIGKLKFLRTLNLEGCSSLGELPEEVGALNSLTEIVMPQNFQRFKLPETIGNLKSLSSIILDEHLGIIQLPNSIGRLVKLTHLSLRGCVGLKKLPCSIGDMEILAELDLSNSGIVELPYSIEYLKKLKVIRVSHTAITKFPHTIGKVAMLEELHAKKCWSLTDENLEEIGKLSHLRILDLSDTPAYVSPKVLSCLSHLQTLEICSSHLEEVPYLPASLTRLHLQALDFPSILNLSSLVNLDYLELSSVTIPTPKTQLIHTHPSGLSTLKVRGLSLLPDFSNSQNLPIPSVIGCPMSRFPISQDLTHLRELKVSNCKLLVDMPGLSLLKNLQCLDLKRLGSLVEINGLSELESLMRFRISHCHQIERLPNLSKLDKLHHIELEGCPKIRVIEGIKGLESMVLDNCGCIVLERLLDASSSTWLSHIAPECQVFLSFSISDTYSIVDVLYTNLVRNQISVSRDDDDLSSGDGIGEQLPLALNDSRIYIVFFF